MHEHPERGTNSIGSTADLTAADWRCVLVARTPAALRITAPWQEIFAPLVDRSGAERLVIGQLGQSLDGRIATSTGHSHYINGRQAVVHLHRLRALVDAVIVGVGTVLADDPQLTVRHVEGPQPARIVVDPQGRLPEGARVLAAGARRIVITRQGGAREVFNGAEVVTLPECEPGHLSPAAILDALEGLGLRRILVEGGAITLSRFLAAGCLDRLHLAVAPLIIGAGPIGITLPPIDRLDDALRPPMRAVRLGEDVLFDIDLAAKR